MRSVFLAVMVAACGSGSDDIVIAFEYPEPGASFVRDQLGPTGALSAMVPIELSVGGAPTRLALAAGVVTLPDADLEGNGLVALRTSGVVTLTATAYDGEQIASTATVDIIVNDLSLATCKEWLDVYGISYTVGPTMPGVMDPVTAKMPINGVPYKVVGAMNPRTQMYGDCRIIKSLAEAAPFFRDRGITQVTDYGVYNYRCIGGGTPPNCPNGVSQHAYAMAIDLAGFTVGTEFYSVNDDWVIDPDSQDTCAAPTEEGKDRFLHELICALDAAKVWNIILTPNYNAAHRDHFHVDLTAGSGFIERRAVGH